MNVAEERLRTGIDDLHRPTGAHREQASMDVKAYVLARAECAADAAERQSHQFGWQPEAFGNLVAIIVQPLGRDDEIHTAVTRRGREPRLGPHESLILHPDLVVALDHDRSVRVDVAAPDDEVAEHVAVGMYRALHRLAQLRVDERHEHLAVDDDRCARAARGLGVIGGDDRDRFTGVADDVGREHGLVAMFEPVAVDRHVAGGQYGVDAVDQQRGTGVDPPDTCGRMGRAQRLAPQHAFGPEVAGKRELAAHLRDTVGPDRALPDPARDARPEVDAHGATLRRASAATSTASRIRP